MAKKRQYVQRTKKARHAAAQRKYLANQVVLKKVADICDLCGEEPAVYKGHDSEGKDIFVGFNCLVAHWEEEPYE
ncbi:Uncharacterised protein [uncultured archaeon]|nr:Uncharacterised protein [uncultured archaeon]